MERTNPDIDRRARPIRQGRRGNGPVVYWMSREQRVHDNWALLFAQQEALAWRKELHVVFCLVPDFPGANLRHYLFLLKGLAGIGWEFESLNITFTLLEGSPPQRLPQYLQRHDAHILIGDFDPLRVKRSWQKELTDAVTIPFYEVDAHNIIPAWVVSTKKEFGAYTIRPKIKRLLDDYLVEFPCVVRHPLPAGRKIANAAIDIGKLSASVTDRSVDEVDWIVPGESAARKIVAEKLGSRLAHYANGRNDPCRDGQSGLSPYLHFGQLAPQRLALQVKKSFDLGEENREAFLEELIVRRELADNFCFHETDYDRFAGFPGWAKVTLDAHRGDSRQYLYSLEQFDLGQTHEQLWNSCQYDLVKTGKLHGYLRMYWAKKILEWTASPEEAMDIAIRLNDRYSLDGRDPNGYAGIAWSIGGVHDRAWQERPVLGKIRYMNEKGCRRKFDVDDYIRANPSILF